VKSSRNMSMSVATNFLNFLKPGFFAIIAKRIHRRASEMV
jgi:hypothetical protein